MRVRLPFGTKITGKKPTIRISNASGNLVLQIEVELTGYTPIADNEPAQAGEEFTHRDVNIGSDVTVKLNSAKISMVDPAEKNCDLDFTARISSKVPGTSGGSVRVKSARKRIKARRK